MINKLLISALLLIGVTLLTSWTDVDKNKGALVSISVTSKGLLQKGYGIEFTMTNLDTRISYKSKSLGPFSAHSFISDLPAGNYIVTEIEVPLGGFKYINRSPGIQEFFGVLKIEDSQNYYLGNFHGIRKTGRINVFHLRLEGDEIPVRLLKKLSKSGITLREADFIKTFPYLKDELLVY